MPELEIIDCTGEYKCTHNVPTEVIARMKEKWQDTDYINQRIQELLSQ